MSKIHVKLKNVPGHATCDGEPSEELLTALNKMAELAYAQLKTPEPNRVYQCTCYNSNGTGFEELCDYCRFLEDADDTEEYDSFKRRQEDCL